MIDFYDSSVVGKPSEILVFLVFLRADPSNFDRSVTSLIFPDFAATLERVMATVSLFVKSDVTENK